MSGVVAKSVAPASAGQVRQRTTAPFKIVGRPATPSQRSRESSVGGRHRGQVGLVVYRERLPEVRPDRVARRIGKTERERNKVIELVRSHGDYFSVSR
jgi:hypothetical protein